jgi:prepilin-type N-terminal cleavage/methylation domain-containing protein
MPTHSIFPNRSRPKAFTALELIIGISVLSILTAIVTVNYTAARRTSRDGVRRSDGHTLLAAVTSYQLSYGSAFIHLTDLSLPCVIPAQFPLDPTQPAIGTGCVGANGRGYGKVNFKGGLIPVNVAQTRLYPSTSITDALTSAGFLASVPKDPQSGSVTDPNQPDYSLIRCSKDGVQNISRGGTRFAIWISLENPPSSQDDVNTTSYCGGRNPKPSLYPKGYAYDFGVSTSQLTRNTIAFGNVGVETENICTP